MTVPKWIGVAAGVCLPVVLLFSGAFGEEEADYAKEAARVAGVYEASAEALDQMRSQLKVEEFDVGALAKIMAGKSPQEIADWVGGHVALTPYRGVLKGAQGALEDQRGNSLDRALLLQALLAANGIEARLARTTIDDAATDKLLAAVDGTPPPQPAPAADDQPILEKLYADPRINGAKMKARNDRERAEAGTQHQAANAQIEKISTRLKEQAAAMLAAKAADAAAERRAALADHWWVQSGKDGVWTDLDPAAGIVGVLSASDTFAPDQLPEDLRRTVTVRIVAELSREGKLGRETLLSHDFDPAVISGRVLVLRHRALDLKPMDAIFAQGGDFNANVIAAVTASSAWTPILALGDDIFTDRLVAIDGDVSEATEANMALHGGQGGEGVAGMGGAIGGAIGGLEDGLSGEPPYDENTGGVKLTAEFVEIETRNPGEPPHIERRALFDAIGPAARVKGDAAAPISDAAKTARGFALLDSVEIIVTTGRLSPARAASRIQDSYAAAFRATAAWLTANDGSPMPDLPEGFHHVNLPLNAFATGRMVYGPGAATRVQTEANAAMTRQGMRPAADGNGLADVITFDIVMNRIKADSVGAGVDAGVSDTVAEYMALNAATTSRSTAVRYAASIDKGESWALIEAGNTTALDALDLDADSKAMVAEDLGRGYAIVVPQRIASLDDAVWWRIDPATGETLGMNALGGAVMTEYNITLAISLANYASCLYKIAKRGPDPGVGKMIGIGTCMLGAAIGGYGAYMGVMLAWQVTAVAGTAGVIGNFADP